MAKGLFVCVWQPRRPNNDDYVAEHQCREPALPEHCYCIRHEMMCIANYGQPSPGHPGASGNPSVGFLQEWEGKV